MLLWIRDAAAVALTLCALSAVALAPARAGAAPCPPGAGLVVFACFDDAPSGSAASAADLGDLDVADAVVLSEADAAFLLGLDTEAWATSDDQGILNSLVSVVELHFDRRIERFELDVVGLPGLAGPLPVVVQGLSGSQVLATATSDVGGVLGDGTHRDRIGVVADAVAFDHVRVFAALGPCAGADCVAGGTTSFFADTVEYALPEPGAAGLAAAGLTLAAALRGRRQEGR